MNYFCNCSANPSLTHPVAIQIAISGAIAEEIYNGLGIVGGMYFCLKFCKIEKFTNN